mmetsp:Transcript_171062/g.548188  ORF Transcript_171062/g.548188 Transcript_171062/m.548188 type:complete len:320 (-) Transcript_171062:82-1041(-)|eukprot:CAMPEP_0203923012 /NCGR_PEP_ID=MMETSP0359-20131031/62971_1 /ASSEMBLY_ACC=CAM_ASM_000338 /TAXON_ID=268821 /ORGANISM="Scrippsiella Hangoei, Strain SHTV-5" /LENGTH=319 /DNA_ID=CAMNT_0050851019 /DNA_START=59 /DNA_END=1018 /DNA_ORIENTATION=-
MSLGLLVSCMQPSRPSEPWHVSAAWWASQVCCVTVEEVPELGEEMEDIRYYVLANGFGHNVLKVENLNLVGPPVGFLGKYIERPIIAVTEMRQHFWAFQPESWITYHVCTILEVDGVEADKLFILIERVDDRLEIMLCVGHIPRSFMLEFRATGRPRRSDKCFQQPRQIVAPIVSVRRLFEWIGTSMANNWKPYHILQSNCQHISEELQSFIRDPSRYSNPNELVHAQLVTPRGTLHQQLWARDHNSTVQQQSPYATQVVQAGIPRSSSMSNSVVGRSIPVAPSFGGYPPAMMQPPFAIKGVPHQAFPVMQHEQACSIQ